MAPTFTTASTKYGIRRMDGSSNVSDVDAGVQAAVDDIDANMAGYAEGTLSARSGVVATAGKLYRTTDTGQVFMGTGSTWIELGVSPWTTGDTKWSWLGADHGAWLLMDGATSRSRATYADLSALFPYPGNGSSTHFILPDGRSRTLVAPDAGAGRIAANNTRGASGGVETVTLVEATIPAHVHGPGAGTLFVNAVAGGTQADDGPGPLINPSPASGTTASYGGGQAHENKAPYLVAGGLFMHV